MDNFYTSGPKGRQLQSAEEEIHRYVWLNLRIAQENPNLVSQINKKAPHEAGLSVTISRCAGQSGGP
jgi:hypothetical protein